MDKIQEIYEDYSDIVSKIGLKKIEQRYMDLYQAYIEFVNVEEIGDKVKINKLMLMNAVMDYFTDISRLKDFHKIDKTNFYKNIAYEICWLLRRKPIQVMEDEEPKLVYINEKFILSYTINFLTRGENNTKYDKLPENRKKAFDGFIESFYYYLKFRNCNAQSLELALLSFEAGLVLNSHELEESEEGMESQA